MEKLLIEDINRNLELMGIQKFLTEQEIFGDSNLLVESSILKSLLRTAQDVATPSIKKFSSGIKEYLVGGRVVGKTFHDAYVKLLKNFDVEWPKFSSNPKNLQELASILRGQETFVKTFYEDLISDFITKTKTISSESQLYRLLKKQEEVMGSQFDLEAELKRFLVNDFERELLAPKISQNYNLYKKGQFKPSVFPRPVDVTSKKLTKSQVAKFNNVLNTSKTFWTDFIGAIRKNIQTLRKEVEEISAGYFDDLAQTSSVDEVKTLTNAYSVQLARKLQQMNVNVKDSALEILKDEGLPQEILQILKTDESLFFKQFRDLIGYKPSNQEFLSEIGDMFATNFTEIADFLKNLFSKNFIKSIKHLLDPSRDLGTWFYTNQWAGLNRLYRLAIKNGAKENTIKYLGKALIATNIGFLTGWITRTGVLTLYELVIKPIYNNTLGKLAEGSCSFMRRLGAKFDCDKVYIPYEKYVEETKVLESALISELFNNSLGVMKKQYGDDPVLYTIWNGTPFLNFTNTWRYSLATKGVETITGKKVLQNYLDEPGDPSGTDPEEKVETIKKEIEQKTPEVKDSTYNITWEN